MFALSISIPTFAAVPNRITYQGRLSKSGMSSGGVHTIRACLKPSVGASYCQDFTPDLPLSGDFTLVIDVPPSIDFINTSVELELTVDGTTLSPPDNFTAVPYALVAATATSILSGGVQLQNSSQDLASWQSASNPQLFNPQRMDVANPPTAAGAGMVPQGAIILWDQSPSCPAGYTRVTSFDGAFPRSAATPAGTGGAASHAHDINHTHTVAMDPHSHGLNSHTHTTGGTTGYYDEGFMEAAVDWVTSSFNYPRLIKELQANGSGDWVRLWGVNHTHGNTGAPSVSNTETATSTGTAVAISTTTSASASSLPPFYDVLFCRKQ